MPTAKKRLSATRSLTLRERIPEHAAEDIIKFRNRSYWDRYLEFQYIRFYQLKLKKSELNFDLQALKDGQLVTNSEDGRTITEALKQAIDLAVRQRQLNGISNRYIESESQNDEKQSEPRPTKKQIIKAGGSVRQPTKVRDVLRKFFKKIGRS